MHYGCYCGAGFELKARDRKSMVDDIDQFCSSACLLKFLKDVWDPKRIDTLDFVAYPRHGKDWMIGHYDQKTDTFFRSGYEVAVAKFFDQHKISWLYEIQMLSFRGVESYYLPDFWLPQHGYAVEVKGLWKQKAKRKFINALKVFPIILIPDYLIKDIKRNAIHSN